MIILSGKTVREKIEKDLVEILSTFSVRPKLVIVQIGDNAESEVYIKQKIKLGMTLNIEVEHIHLNENIKERELLKRIDMCNNDKSVNGIIVQLPIPKHLNQRLVLDSIDHTKDVDGLGSAQSGLLYVNSNKAIIPATVRGIMSLFDYYNISIEGKRVCVVGRSFLVGRPLATLCLNRNATVTICHSYTKNLEEITKSADILIVAIGKPNFINQKHIGKNQTVVDVGIHKMGEKMCGDVDLGAVGGVVSALTPVPGGVGPLTVISLFQNLVDAKIAQNVL